MLAAHLWGDAAQLEGRVAAQLAAEQRQRKARDEVPEDEVDEAAERWRYERDLISADDLESWLSTRALTSDEWLAWVRRSLAAARPAPARAKGAFAESDIEPLLFVEGMCSGLFTELINHLAGRAAAFERVAAERLGLAPTTASVRDTMKRLPASVRRRGLFELSPSESAKRAAEIAAMDATFERFVKTLTPMKAVQRELESHALAWTRVGRQTLTFPSRDQAREAALLIREDGLSFAKAASIASVRGDAVSQVLEDVDGVLRDRLAAAQAGELVGPYETEDGFSVTLVTERVSPSMDDRAIRRRARNLIVQRIVDAEIDNRVRWHERF